MTDVCQRWNNGRDSYRPAGETIVTSAYDVAPIDELTAKRYVTAHHYSKTYPAARFRFGLHRGGELVGVAVFSHPSNDKVLAIFPGTPRESVELGRFVLADDVPANGETWMLARCFEQLRRESIHGVISFSDPEPRTSADGSAVFPGHIGTIYQAHNAVYLGRATARTLRLMADGRVFSPRTASKIRNLERGWKYAVEQLVAFGAEKPRDEDLTSWMNRELAKITRPLRHAGNHRYAWALDRSAARVLPKSLPYPKAI